MGWGPTVESRGAVCAHLKNALVTLLIPQQIAHWGDVILFIFK